jgi:hypothetical protein
MMKTEEMFCASPVCVVASFTHPRTGSCPPVSESTIKEILSAVAVEAEQESAYREASELPAGVIVAIGDRVVLAGEDPAVVAADYDITLDVVKAIVIGRSMDWSGQ